MGREQGQHARKEPLPFRWMPGNGCGSRQRAALITEGLAGMGGGGWRAGASWGGKRSADARVGRLLRRRLRRGRVDTPCWWTR